MAQCVASDVAESRGVGGFSDAETVADDDNRAPERTRRPQTPSAPSQASAAAQAVSGEACQLARL